MRLNATQIRDWERDGFLVVKDAVSAQQCSGLIDRATSIVDQFDPQTVSVFSTHEQTRTTDEYFMASGDSISCFFEEGAFDETGNLNCDKALAINKIGHALHDLDPVFDQFSRQDVFADTARSIGFTSPLLLQSMYIFKQPHIGGEVTCHQDSTFLYTNPMTAVGFWVALQDANIENGCLWVQPGGHQTPLRKRFLRHPDGNTRFEELDPMPYPEPGSADLVPIEVRAGTMVLLHGLLPHWSDVNHSSRGRHAYTVHIIDGDANYPEDNWLRRTPELPLRGFDKA